MKLLISTTRPKCSNSPPYSPDKPGARQYTWAAPASLADAPLHPSATYQPSDTHENPCAPPASPQTLTDTRVIVHASPYTIHPLPPSPDHDDSPCGIDDGAPCDGGVDGAHGGETLQSALVGCELRIGPWLNGWCLMHHCRSED